MADRVFRAMVLFFLISAAFFGLAGCDRAVESFSVEVYGPDVSEAGADPITVVPLREKPGVSPEEEGLLLETDEGLATPWYEFRFPGTGMEGEWPEEVIFRLVYSSTGPLLLELENEAGERRQHRLPAAVGGEVEVRIPLPFSGLHAFRFREEGKNPEVVLAGDARFTLHSIDLIGRDPVGGQTLSLVSPDEFPGDEARFVQYGLGLEYSYDPVVVQANLDDEEDNVTIELQGAEQQLPLRLFVRKGTHQVYFYSRDLTFIPQALFLRDSLPGFRIEKTMVRPVSLLVEPVPDPIPADMGTVLNYDRRAWRRSDYELFSWSMFPSILVFDFRDYRLQSAFLKRLSFFVEKKGSTGRLLPNSVIEPLHGWNAHDYRAEDLARFFQQAEEESFQLNEEEYLLRSILLKHGIILREGGEWLSGTGGILSLSRESSDRLRYLFITHEGYHGLYFASGEYRERVEAIWNTLSADEQRFWKFFLDWKLYEVDDVDLVINEFQAYLMQQHLSYVDTYFKEYTIPRLVRRFPEYEAEAAFFLEEYPDHFIRSARHIQAAAESLAGIRAGDLVCLRE